MSTNPFLDKNTDLLYSSKIIPELQHTVKQIQLNCTDCFLPEIRWKTFTGNFRDIEFCVKPLSKNCEESFITSLILKVKVQAILSTPLEYLGSAVANGIIQSDSNYMQGLYQRFSGVDAGISPKLLANVLISGSETDLSKQSQMSRAQDVDELSNNCWGADILSNFTYCTSSEEFKYPDCCCNLKLCKFGTFQSLLSVLKESIRPAHVFHHGEVSSSFQGNLSELKMPSFINKDLTNFPILFGKKSPTAKEMKRFFNLRPFIPLCKLTNLFSHQKPKWGTNPDSLMYDASFCTLFRPTFTDQGICYAFNAKQPHLVMKPSPFLKAFQEVFGTSHSFGEDFEPFNITGMGPNNGLTLYLDAQKSVGQFKSNKVKNNYFQINFQNFNNFPLLSLGGINVKPGQKTKIVLTPKVLKSTDEVQSLLDRNCYFPDDVTNSDLFSSYSHSGCIFECMLKQSAMECGCIPLKYPQMGNETEICDLMGNVCTNDVMNENARILQCNCKADCSNINYDYYIVQEEVNPAMECNNTEENAFLIEYLRKYQMDAHMVPFWNKINVATGKSTAEQIKLEEDTLCSKRISNDIAIVEIYFSTPFVTRMKQDVRKTFTDKISDIGKFFNGVPFTVVFELSN